MTLTPFLFLSINMNCHFATLSSWLRSAFFPRNSEFNESLLFPTNAFVIKSIKCCKKFFFSLGGHFFQGLLPSFERKCIDGGISDKLWCPTPPIKLSDFPGFVLAKQFGWAGICTEVFSIGRPVVEFTHQQYPLAYDKIMIIRYNSGVACGQLVLFRRKL